MEKMIDNMILIGGARVALKMEWVKLAYNETDDLDAAVLRLLKLQKE